MIQIECLNSPDINALGIYEYQQNMIYVGRKNTDLLLQDLSWPADAMMFEVVEDQFYIHPQKDLSFFLVNGKRSTGVKKIKRQDIITIGETQIKLIDFLSTEFISKKQTLDKKLKELVETNSPKLSIVRKLTEIMNQK